MTVFGGQICLMDKNSYQASFYVVIIAGKKFSADRERTYSCLCICACSYCLTIKWRICDG